MGERTSKPHLENIEKILLNREICELRLSF